jgi:para-nitrobenzyl esterase
MANSNGTDRRDWLKSAAVLAGAAAIPVAVTPTDAAAQPRQGQPKVTTTDKSVVETTAGKVRGFTRDGVQIFRGIPYGDTTGGENRYRAAKKPQPWTGVRSSTSWGPVCPQAVRAGWRNDEEQFLYQWDDGFPGEDMLRINVWTPAVNDNRRRPVLVWIHGGGFVSGSSQELRPYDGASLASRHDAVVVSMNHRLNVFGFLDLSEYGADYADSANLGMLDLVLALQWVKENVGNFGGDAGNVTIFGQSGGGRKVSTLLAMPAASGLFHKAAVFSGSHLRQIEPDASRRLAAAVLDVLGVARADVAKLRQLAPEQLVKAAADAQRKLAPAPAAPGAPAPAAPAWGPVVDGRSLPRHAFDPDASPVGASVPLLVGNTYAEFGGGMNNPAAHLLTIDELRTRLNPTLGGRTNDVIAAYQKVFPKARPFEIAGLVTGTQAYRINAVRQAERKAAQNAAPVYMYWFGWQTPVLDGRPLAYHCQDLAFWFDNIDLAAQATGGGDDARELARTMSSAFVAFARTGNPSASAGPRWPAFSVSSRATMVFDNSGAAVRNDPDAEARRLLEGGARS